MTTASAAYNALPAVPLPLDVVPGGHFLLQEDTSEAAELLRAHLGSG